MSDAGAPKYTVLTIAYASRSTVKSSCPQGADRFNCVDPTPDPTATDVLQNHYLHLHVGQLCGLLPNSEILFHQRLIA